MPFEIKKRDGEKLDEAIRIILEALENGEVERSQVSFLMSHLIMLAADDNEEDVRSYMDPRQAKRWVKEAIEALGKKAD